MDSGTSYVVMATVNGERACWLTNPRLAGHRTFAALHFAERFESESQAADAILVVMCNEECRGIVFTVEGEGLD
jgi:hypothetical protein